MNKKILILMSEIPYPVFKGNQNRIMEFIKVFINLGCDVYLNILNNNQKHRKSIDIEKDIHEAFPAIKQVKVRRHPVFKKNKLYSIEKFFNKKNSISNLETVPRNFRKLVKDSIKEIDPDIVFVNYLKLSNAIPFWYKGLHVCDLHDIQCNITKEAMQLNMLKKKIDIEKFCKSEIELMKKYDTLIAINPNESKQIANIIKVHKNIVTIPVFMQLPKLDKNSNYDYDILFVGSGSPFNIDASMKFIAKSMPILRKKNKDIKFAIVGDVANTSALKKVHNKDVIKLGRVDNLDRVYAKSKVVICPLRGGAGMKVKVIEALAYGKAIVTTSIGADGIQIIDSLNGFIEDDWIKFADKIALLLENNDIRLKIERNARLTAIKYYQPKSIHAQLKKIVYGYDEYYSNIHADIDSIESKKTNTTSNEFIKKKVMIFSMEARSLMNYSIDFGKKILNKGVEPIFIKMENSYFNIFHINGLNVISIKDHFEKVDKQINSIIKKYNVDVEGLNNLIYSDIDFSEDVKIHKMMFPEHFKGIKQETSVRYLYKILITIDKIMKMYKPDALLDWNGNGPHLMYLLKVLAKKYSIPIVHMERGLLPNTYIVDKQGVNFKSCFAGSYLPLVTKQETSNVHKYKLEFQRSMQSIVGASEVSKTKEVVYSELGLSLTDNYIFFPQQIEGDSNIIINSSKYKKMDNVLDDLLIVAKHLNLKIVTREHPENNKTKEKLYRNKFIILNNKIHIHNLLKYSICNVVINSTVGLESLVLGKPTITLGNSLYSGKGFTYDVCSHEDIIYIIKNKIKNTQKLTKSQVSNFDRFLSYLIHDYLIFLHSDRGKRSIENILNGIGLNSNGNLKPSLDFTDNLFHNNNIYNSIIRSIGKEIILVDSLGANSKRYYTGVNRPSVNITIFFEENINFCKKNNISVISTEENIELLNRTYNLISAKSYEYKNIKDKFHKIVKILKEINNNYNFAIVIVHQSEKDWIPFLKKQNNNVNIIFIDEYFVVY